MAANAVLGLCSIQLFQSNPVVYQVSNDLTPGHSKPRSFSVQPGILFYSQQDPHMVSLTVHQGHSFVEGWAAESTLATRGWWLFCVHG